MAAHKTFPVALADFGLFFGLLFAPYLIFADNNYMLAGTFNVIPVAILAICASVLTILLRFWRSPTLRAVLVACLLILFADIQFNIQVIQLPWLKPYLPWAAGNYLFALLAFAIVLIAYLLRQHIGQIAGAMVATVIASTAAMALMQAFTPRQAVSPGPGFHTSTALPLYLHIVLDEHIGVAGLNRTNASGDTIQNDLVNFYVKHRFRVFSRAYSQYMYTRDSLAAAFNFNSDKEPKSLVLKVSNRPLRDNIKYQYRLTQNQYFDDLIQRGYRLHVYQTNWIDLCAYGARIIQNCRTYPYTINSAALAKFSFSERALLALQTYAKLSIIAVQTYNVFEAVTQGPRQPRKMTNFRLWRTWLGPPVSFPAIDALLNDLTNARRGEAYLAHLLLPHHPYSVDATCTIRRPVIGAWKDLRDSDLREFVFNSVNTRAERYPLYIAQLRCAMKKLDAIFAVLRKKGLFEDAIIIVHSDHGSKLFRNAPYFENAGQLQRQDYFDAFSTLFALKAPNVRPSIDETMNSVKGLLKHTASGALARGSPLAPEESPTVFVHSRRDPDQPGKLLPLAMPLLPRQEEW